MNMDYKHKKLTPLYIISIFCLIFSILEILCGVIISNSITLMADALHYFSESTCFTIYIVSIYVFRKGTKNNMSFGFHRGEIIGVLLHTNFLYGLSFWLLYYVIFIYITQKS